MLDGFRGDVGMVPSRTLPPSSSLGEIGVSRCDCDERASERASERERRRERSFIDNQEVT